MFSESDIIAKAWMVKEVANIELAKEGLYVDKILLCGSYANGTASDHSDVDFIVQTGGSKLPYPKDVWSTLANITEKIKPQEKIHLIFGTLDAAESLHQKHANQKRSYAYRVIPLVGLQIPKEA